MFSRFIVATTALLFIGQSGSAITLADGDKPRFQITSSEAPPPALPQPRDGQQDAPPGLRIQLQLSDDEATPFQPAKPKTKRERDRSDAVSWFMTGRLREKRKDFRGALDAYKKAADIDPTAGAIYQALVPLAFGLNRTDDAIKYARKAVELDPNDFQLLRRLGFIMARKGKFPEALDFLERAAKSNRLDHKSGVYVTLMRDLAVIYGVVGQKEKAADHYEIVFDALTNRGKYSISSRTRQDLEKNPATTYEMIGQTFLAADRTDLAIRAFERAAKARKGKPGTLSFNLAQVYAKTKQFQKAREHLQTYFDAQLQSRGRLAYQLLAQILTGLGEQDQLIPEIEKLAESDPKNSHLQYYLADQYVEQDRLKEAEELFKKAHASFGGVTGQIGLAKIYRKQNRAKELLKSLSAALEKIQDAKDQAGNLDAEMKEVAKDEKLIDGLITAGREMSKGDSPELDFPGSILLARLAIQSDKDTAGIEFFRFALKLRPDRASLIYNDLGRLLLQTRQFAEAEKVYQDAVNDAALAGLKPNYLYLLSQARELGGKTESALKAVAEAKKIAPDAPLLHFQEGWIHYHSRNWSRAIPLFNEMIEKFSDRPDDQSKRLVRRSQFSLSNIYVQQGDMKKGEKILEDIYKVDPDDIGVCNDLGYLYADQGKNLKQAEEMIRKAIKAEPDNAAYLDSMGWVLFKLEKYDEAADWLKKASLKSEGQDSTIFDHLGDCYLKLKKDDDARKAFQKAFDLMKEEPTPDEKLKKSVDEKLKKLGTAKKSESAPEPAKPEPK